MPVLVVLVRRAEQDLVALAALHERPDRRCGVLTAVDEGDRAVAGGAAHEAQRVLGRPVGGVGMALGRHHERDLTAGASAAGDLLEQQRRRLGAVGDHEQPP